MRKALLAALLLGMLWACNDESGEDPADPKNDTAGTKTPTASKADTIIIEGNSVGDTVRVFNQGIYFGGDTITLQKD